MKRVSSRVRPLLIVNNPLFISDRTMATGRSGSSSIYARSAANASSNNVPAQQLPGSMSAKKLRAVRSRRFNVRLMK